MRFLLNVNNADCVDDVLGKVVLSKLTEDVKSCLINNVIFVFFVHCSFAKLKF